jgi:hypothetical protein
VCVFARVEPSSVSEGRQVIMTPTATSTATSSDANQRLPLLSNGPDCAQQPNSPTTTTSYRSACSWPEQADSLHILIDSDADVEVNNTADDPPMSKSSSSSSTVSDCSMTNVPLLRGNHAHGASGAHHGNSKHLCYNATDPQADISSIGLPAPTRDESRFPKDRLKTCVGE